MELIRITLWDNKRDLDIKEIRTLARKTTLPYCSLPTSGPTTLWLRYDNNHSTRHYGPTAVRYALNAILTSKASQKSPAQP